MSKINETIAQIRKMSDESESVSEIKESFSYDPASTGIELKVSDLKSLAQSHERLLAAAKMALAWSDDTSAEDGKREREMVKQAIQEAEK